jgi:hypothetical protein
MQHQFEVGGSVLILAELLAIAFNGSKYPAARIRPNESKILAIDPDVIRFVVFIALLCLG